MMPKDSMNNSDSHSDNNHTNNPQLFRDSLLEEQPKIDSALKSFTSLLVAQSATTTTTTSVRGDDDHDYGAALVVMWTLMDCLPVTRHVSKHMNQHIVAIHRRGAAKTTAATRSSTTNCKNNSNEEHNEHREEVAQQVWNELVACQQKPTKLLGRTALRLIWDDLDLEQALLALHHTNNTTTTNITTLDDNDDETQDDDQEEWRNRVTSYVRHFHELLTHDDNDNNINHTRSDSALLWHADRGASELARRAAERQERAVQLIQQQQQQQQLVTVESTTATTTTTTATLSSRKKVSQKN